MILDAQTEVEFRLEPVGRLRLCHFIGVVEGHDVRTALVAFGVDASHGYERIHLDALRSIGELLLHYVTSPMAIKRDVEDFVEVQDFTK